MPTEGSLAGGPRLVTGEWIGPCGALQREKKGVGGGKAEEGEAGGLPAVAEGSPAGGPAAGGSGKRTSTRASWLRR